jgi:F-type H+-transporting ATPase subunit b
MEMEINRTPSMAPRSAWSSWGCFACTLTCLLLFVVPATLSQAADEDHGSAHEAVDDSLLLGQIKSELHLDKNIIAAQAVGFLIMFVILWLLVFRRVGGLLEKRRDDIVSRMDQIEADQQEAASLRDEVAQRLAEIERDAQSRIAQATEQAEDRRTAILEEARASADEEIGRARETIERERDAAILGIRAEVADLVVTATRSILGEALDDERQRQIVEEMIGRLSAESS